MKEKSSFKNTCFIGALSPHSVFYGRSSLKLSDSSCALSFTLICLWILLISYRVQGFRDPFPEQHGCVCIAGSTNTLTHGPTKYQHTKIHSKKTTKIKKNNKNIAGSTYNLTKKKSSKTQVLPLNMKKQSHNNRR